MFLKKFIPCIALTFLIACGDDDDFTPVARNRGYDYAFVSKSEFADYPCNDVREGRDAVVGRDKDMYTCVFNRADSVYLWVGNSDTLTANGHEYKRSSSSSSSSSSDDELSSSSSRNSSSSYSSSYSYSSSSYYGSSANPSSSFSLESKEDIFNPNISYGIMTDPRDGKKYKTVVVNGQTWMAENLNFADSINYPILKGKTRCYQDDENDCELLGRFYSRDAAMNDSNCEYRSYCSLSSSSIQGICPDGWHIVSYAEAENLVDYVGATSANDVMSTHGWGGEVTGNNKYGLSFTSPGSWDSRDDFDSRGGYSYTWVFKNESSAQHYILIHGLAGKITNTDFNSRESYFTVRCISDTRPTIPSSSSYSSSSISSLSISSSSISSSSSSSAISSSSVTPNSSFSITSKEELFNPAISYGIMTDSRDNKTYRTIEVNGQTWMAENLNFSDSLNYPLLQGNTLCYNNDPDDCEIFGRLYNRVAATNSSECAFGEECALGADPIQGICPDGWHLPIHSEATKMTNYVGFTKAADALSLNGWGQTVTANDIYGLSFASTGRYANGAFNGRGGYMHVWVYDNSATQYYILIQGTQGVITVQPFTEWEMTMPIRCIKD